MLEVAGGGEELRLVVVHRCLFYIFNFLMRYIKQSYHSFNQYKVNINYLHIIVFELFSFIYPIILFLLSFSLLNIGD